jgi:hypothetical protein
MANALPYWLEETPDGRILFIDNHTLFVISWFYKSDQVRKCFPDKQMVREAYAEDKERTYRSPEDLGR